MRKGKLKHRLIKSGIARLLRVINKTPRVIFYHGVGAEYDMSPLHINPKTFKEEVQFLARHYEVISIDEYYNRFISNRFNGREIVITFDDGYKNNLVNAAPILKSLQLPFTIFVSTAHMENEHRFPTFIARAITRFPKLSYLKLDCICFESPLTDDAQRRQICSLITHTIKHANIRLVEKICQQLISNITPGEYETICQQYKEDEPLNWEEVIGLSSDYDCTIGSHCVDHCICNGYQSQKDINRQLIESKRIIEEKTGKPCHYLAYPNGIVHEGDISDYAQETAAKAGYRLAFTTISDRLLPNNNPFLMPRCAARFEMDDFIMKLVLKPKIQL